MNFFILQELFLAVSAEYRDWSSPIGQPKEDIGNRTSTEPMETTRNGETTPSPDTPAAFQPIGLSPPTKCTIIEFF